MKRYFFKNKGIKLLAALMVLAVLTASVTACKKEGPVTKPAAAGSEEAKTEVSSGGDLKIKKSEISETAKFYGYKAGDTYMEVVAVKAKDGSIKTALNTCQVCYASGRGYYKQEGDTLVCQNCGNVFDIAYIGKAKNGCNPVPIDTKAKTDDSGSIVINKDFLDSAKGLFAKWKK